ncbi:hypothetical protein F5Y10DRAFT_293656 [Nemania abortiva]|nr:hypothetical protein F5Y10DRAFT_293656 [Nemania abortiva]
MAEPLHIGDADPADPIDQVDEDRNPTFADFPILRTILFLAGFDVETALDPVRRGEREVTYTRAVFSLMSAGHTSDTARTWGGTSSSFLEIVSGLGTIGVVTALVRLYYTNTRAQGEESHASPGLGVEVEAPILAAFFTLCSLITALYVFLAVADTTGPLLDGLFVHQVFPPVEDCAICHQALDEPLISLQCFPDADEAANPQRALHYCHESCIAGRWWNELEIWHLADPTDPPEQPPQRRCPICTNRVLGYRRPADVGDHGEPSALAWSTYFFFASVVILFGHLHPHMHRGLPEAKTAQSNWHAYVLTRGIVVICLLLLARLIFARILYVCYLVFPHLLRMCLQSNVRQSVYQYVVQTTPPPLHLSKGETWGLAVAVLVLAFMLIHGCALRIADTIYYCFRPRGLYAGYQFRMPSNNSAPLTRILRRLVVPWTLTTRALFALVSPVNTLGYESVLSYVLSLVCLSVWSFWAVTGSMSLSVYDFIAYIRMLGFTTGGWIFTFYKLGFVLIASSVSLFALFMTLWDDIIAPVIIFISGHVFMKGVTAFLAQIEHSLGRPWDGSNVRLPFPLQGFLEWAIVILYQLPLVLMMLHYAWSNSPPRSTSPPRSVQPPRS